MDRSSKNPGPSPEHRLNVILEELQGQFRTFGEGLADVQEKTSQVLKKLDPMEEDIKLIKSVIPTLTTKKDLEALEKRLQALETH